MQGIVDHALHVWTIDFADMRVLRDGVNVGGGYGSVLLWLDDVLYVLGTDMNWWNWADANGNITGYIVGKEEPVHGTPTPTAAPTATPATPTPAPTGTPMTGPQYVNLAWDPPPPAGPNDTPVTGYHIMVSTNGHYFSDEDNIDVPDPKASGGTVKGLQPNTTYWFCVTAYGANKHDSYISNVISYTTPAATAAARKTPTLKTNKLRRQK
jgi:hypothetical protein